MNNTDQIHRQYNADHDMNPDPKAPRVTWAEKELANCVDLLQAKIEKLEKRIQALESAQPGLPASIQEALNSGDGTYRP